LLVPIIEEGRDARDPLVSLAIGQYLDPLIERGIDVLLLGCTHYPMLKGLFANMVGPNITVIDSAEACAEDVHRRLTSAGLLRGGGPTGAAGSLHCFATDDSPRFARLASHFLGFEVPPPTWVPPEELYGVPAQPQPLRKAI
jgi:glutamate racemase